MKIYARIRLNDGSAIIMQTNRAVYDEKIIWQLFIRKSLLISLRVKNPFRNILLFVFDHASMLR